MALTTEQIHATADQLHVDGIKPTLANVRKALGGGSFTTISDAMQSWRQDHAQEQELQQIELPSGINDRLQTLGADMWQTAIDIANDRLTKEREALEVIKAKAQQDVDEYAESVKTLEAEQTELLNQLDDVTTTADKATAQADKTKAEYDTLKKSLNDVEHTLALERTKADSAQQQLEEVRKTLSDTQAELTATTAKVAKLEATADSDKAEIERLRAELKATKADLKTVTAERDEARQGNAEIKGELKAVIAERDKLVLDNNQLTKAHAKIEAEYNELDKNYGDLFTNYTYEQSRVSDLQRDLDRLTEQSKVPETTRKTRAKKTTTEPNK